MTKQIDFLAPLRAAEAAEADALAALRAAEERLRDLNKEVGNIRSSAFNQTINNGRAYAAVIAEQADKKRAMVQPDIDLEKENVGRLRAIWADAARFAAALRDFHAKRWPARPRLFTRSLPDLTVEEARAQIAELRVQRTRIEAAPPTGAERVHLIRRLLAEVVPAVEAVGNGLDPLRLELLLAPAARHGDSNLPVSGADPAGVAGLLLWLFRDQLAEALIAELPASGDVELTQEARHIELQRIDRDILAVERAEEASIRRSEIGGYKIARRADASPWAVFMLEIADAA